MSVKTAPVRPIKRNTALKDRQLVYRACTLGYARSLRLESPKQVVGRTDADLLDQQSSELVRQAEQRMLGNGIPEVSEGKTLRPDLNGLFVLRSPVINSHGQISGIEIAVLTAADLQFSCHEQFARHHQYRDMANQIPFGMLVHRDGMLLYQNPQWSTLVDEAKQQTTADELRAFLSRIGQFGVGSELDQTPAVFDTTGGTIEHNGRYLIFGRKALLWNSQQATLVFCFQVNKESAEAGSVQGSAPGLASNFVEKRLGARRELSVAGADHEKLLVKDKSTEAALFNSLRHPVFVCSNWTPMHANSAADFFLKELSASGVGIVAGRYPSIESWFTEREKADIETMIRQRGIVDSSVSVSIAVDNQRYLATVSSTVWEGRSALLVSMQIEAARQRELDNLQEQLRKLEDFASSAGDFFWEMDSEQRLTHISANLQLLLGVPNEEILGVPLEVIIERHVRPEDMAEWSGLTIDLRNYVRFRDRDFKWQHKNGSERVVRLSGVPVHNDAKEFVGFRGLGTDYTAAFNNASSVAYHASHDSLTGLVNRREFEARCDEAILSARSGQVSHALCFMDLDNFKVVNDTCGHLAGDELLRQLSALFSGLVRKSDVLARLGGDEFGVLIFDVGLKEAMRLADQLRAEVESFQFLWEDNRFTVGASIGIVIVDDHWESRSSLFGAADAVCYEAKNQGRNRVAVYQQSGPGAEVNAGANHWVESINSAISEKRIRLCMQKIITLDSWDNTASNVELLMRMVSPEGEIISPNAFLPAADRYGLSVKLDRVVVELAIDWLEGQPHVTESMELCAINLNGRSFADEDFTQFLLDALKAARFDVSILCFEISETAAIANLSAVSLFMKRVGEMGCQFALDDFGSGLSSFAYLKNLPVKYLKIDGLFVKDILEDSIDFAMVKAINEIGQTLGKKTIAEFVENDEILDKLRDMGVNFAQGYHIGKPEIIDF